jgi:hypothetical protein
MDPTPSELVTDEQQAAWYAEHQHPSTVFNSIFVAIWRCYMFQRTPSQNEVLRILIFSLAYALNKRGYPIQEILAVCGAIGFPPSTGGEGGEYMVLAGHYLNLLDNEDPEIPESIQTTKDRLKKCVNVMMERRGGYSFYTIQLENTGDEIGSWDTIGDRTERRWNLLRNILEKKGLLYEGDDNFEVVLVDLNLEREKRKKCCLM